MTSTQEDFYIAMLRFGQSQMEGGFQIQDIVDHLQKRGYDIKSMYDNRLQHYFSIAFFSKENTLSYPDTVSRHFLRPEGYFQLLEYENMLASLKDAKETRRLSIIAIVISIIAIILPYILKWLK